VIDAAISASVQAYEREQVKRTGQQVQERLAYLVHELKTPLSAAHTAAMLLENRLSKDALKGVGTMLHILLRNCERLEAMVLKVIEENVASPSRDNEHLDPGVFQLRPLVQGILENVRSIVENESISVRNEVPEDLYIYADDFLMSQVIQNLLSNALKYTPKGEVVVGAESKAEHALLWVQDTGTGIEPQMLDRIFQKNVGDPDRPESTGLGLAIVQKIVEAHRGKIHVESTVGQGSRFVIELPPLPAAV
jgi:signal transduction histidine kinase